MPEQPIYDAVVRDHGFDPSTVTPFDFDAFLLAHKVVKVTKPRKAARRARRT